MIHTQHLYLRLMEKEDMALYCRSFPEPETGPLGTDPALARAVEDALRNGLVHEDSLDMLIFLEETGELCGKLCLQRRDTEAPELGIHMVPACRGCGYGPEAIRSFTAWYAQTFGVNTFTVRIDPDNAHSRHVFRKLGAKYHGRIPKLSKEELDTFRAALPEADLTPLEALKADLFTLSADRPIVGRQMGADGV